MAAAGCSATMLDVLAESTPKHLWYWLNVAARPTTDALNFGTLCHYAILQGDLYREKFYVRPEGMKMTTKDGKAWKEQHADKPDITFEDALHISGMVEAVRHHKFAARLLHNGQPEQSLFVYDKLGTLRKSRLDSLTAGNALADVKTCRTASMEAFERVVAQRRYHVRAAFYLDNCNLMNLDKSFYFFICVEKQPPYVVRCLQLNGDVIEFGRKVYASDLQTYRMCLNNDEWPAYSDSFEEVALPSYAMKQIYELI
jgi:hypothetical protein